MEKTPASSAMDWSIELEKSLRSQKPGKSIEALEKIGRRLESWNSEPKLMFAEFIMFGLVPGEDKFFLNAIFLRLADAFKLGNKHVKNGVVKIFVRMRRRKQSDREGVLSKGKLENYVELLSRVKEVFDKGDDEERAMALLLFGCWAYFTKDSVDIRYIVLSSLVSDDVLQVKAALFAAGCLSELSDDFANVFLEILQTTFFSHEKPKSIELAGGRAFAKMWCSLSLAEKAYKTGLKLLMDSSDDEFSAVMLISLSRIACHWMLLIPTQIELLTLFQSEERSFHVRATSLRCHRIILGRGVCNFPSEMGTVHKLFTMLHRSELPPALQLEALRVLYKILLFNLSIIPCVEIPELFQQLFLAVKNTLESPIVSSRVLAVSLLADLSGKVLGRRDMVGGAGNALAFKVISFVLDQILLLVTPKVDIHQADFSVDLEIKSLLNTLLNLVKKHPYLHCLVLDNICLFIEKLMKMLDKDMNTEKLGSANQEMVMFGSHGKLLPQLKIILSVSKIVVSCLQNLDYTEAETSKVLALLKLQAENVCHCSYIGGYTSVTYFLILHLHSTFICMRFITEDLMSLKRNLLSLSCYNSILQLDKSTLDCAKMMIRTDGYWYSYKAGKIAACQGAWLTASFIFEQLMTVVQSVSCVNWLKSLAQFSNTEKQIQLLLLPDQETIVVPAEGDLVINSLKNNSCNYMDNLLRACDALLSAEEILAASDIGNIFRFQRWFLTLRAKALKTVVDMMKLQYKISPIHYGTGLGGQLASGSINSRITSQTLGPFIDSCMEVSCRMKKLAQEFDLLLTSFMGMDERSMTTVSALALSCSIMAFTAGFAFLVRDANFSENYGVSNSGTSKEPVHALLIEDLVGRSMHIDCKTRENLLVLLKSFRNCNSCFSSKFKDQFSCSYEARVLHKLCQYSVGEILSLQKEAIKVKEDGDALGRILNSGSQLMMNIISKLMLIPFHTPHYFFRVRPAVSSSLFVMNEAGLTVDGSSISSGVPLSLNLSYQVKNMPSGPLGQLNKVYCILDCKREAQLSQKDDDIDDMTDLNDKLLRCVEARGLHCRRQENYCSTVSEYVCFELNERGQGFSTCFLDVSSLPVGSYRIKWLSCCLDSGGSYWNLLPVNAGPLFTVNGVMTL